MRTTPVPDDLAPHYASDLAATMTRPGSRLFAALRRQHLARELRRLTRLTTAPIILDVGCGTGDLALVARSRGCAVLAADASPKPPPELAGRADIAYLRFDFESYEILDPHPGGPYCVVLRHVLEHARDPRRMLARLREQGAREFYLVVPNADSRERHLLGKYWYSWDPPRHLWHFDESSLDRLCEVAGLTELDRGTATAPTLLPSLYRYLRINGWPESAYRHLAPNSTIAALSAPLNLLVGGNVLWRVVGAED